MKRIGFFFFLFLMVLDVKSQIITTVAGNGVSGYSGDGGQATAAELYYPNFVILDNSGNIYIGDTHNNVVRLVNTSGIISTYAGNGVSGYAGDGGQATAAEFDNIEGLAVDGSGNLYIADMQNNRVRIVNTSGVITTFAGIGVAGYSGNGGQATDAELDLPDGIALDASGQLYIADHGNQRIRRVGIAGIIGTFAGNGIAGFSGDGGQATAAEFDDPNAVVVDASGNIYVADVSNNLIREVNTSGIINTITGNGTAGYSGDGGQATAAEIEQSFPQVDAYFNVYVSDRDASRIRMVNSSGVINTVAGIGVAGYSGDGGQATAAEFNLPYFLAFDAEGNYYITDHDNSSIREVYMALSLTTAVTAVSCYGTTSGDASVTVADGTTPYTYLWSDGATTSAISGLWAGTYTVTVTDYDAITGTATAIVTQPAALSVSASVTANEICGGGNDGIIQITASGGTPLYQYQWTSGFFSGISFSSTITGLVAGSYTLTVRDANGCTATTSATITQPFAIEDSVASSTCSGYSPGSAVVGVKYGVTPYTYIWSSGQTTASATGLSIGSYNVTITDNSGCESSLVVDINGCVVGNYDYAIHYTYDIEGNVASIVTENRDVTTVNQKFKRTDYYYDLVSGKVNELIYEHDSTDQFMHAYEYDADNRISDVQTSNDSLYWENDAGYSYYWQGPLAREVIGRRQVQGVDYAYTLNGWIKGVNSSVLNPSFDMGADGNVHDDNATIGRDAYGFTLNYYNGDYRAIGGANFTVTGLPYTSLYNGNIAAATYSVKPLQPKTIGYNYSYDQLNRIVEMQAFAGIDTTTLQWVAADSIQSFRERENYDENGNILSYIRHGNTAIGPEPMDSLNYNYYTGTNQLRNVRDAVPATNYPNDIDDEPSKYNYRYNSIGQLAKDSAGGIDTIIWNVYGKVKKIVFNSAYLTPYTQVPDSIVFAYDPLGNRLEKRVYNHDIPPVYTCTICPTEIGSTDTTLYQRDAQGNILTIYDEKLDTVRLNEWDIYGSKRIGVLDTDLLIFPPLITPPFNKPLVVFTYTTNTAIVALNPINFADSSTTAYNEGLKQYELTNHLGNVLVTVSDRKWAIDTTMTPNIANYYQPNIINSQDYYPFGMPEPGRLYSVYGGDTLYRYAYQGSMKDDDIHGKGNAYTTTNREDDEWYDRWWSPDHVVKPGESPYVSMGNNPIVGKDDDGNVVIFINGMYTDNSGGTAAYWGSYSQDIMTQLKDYSARYVDGSLGGSKNTTDAAKKGFWSGIWGVIISVLTESNVNMQVRINAGEAQGLKDAASIIANLKPGETIKIITHSMGTAFARGYVKGILEYTEAQHGNLKNNKGQTVTVKIDIEIDVNAFQSKDIPKPDKSNIGYAYSKTGESGVQEIPGFGTTPQGTTDISTDKDKASGHSIETNDQHPTEGNITSDLSNPINTYKADANKGGNPANIEEGNNNADAPK